MTDLKKRVKENCFPGMCLQECLPVAQELKDNPCFNGFFRDKSLFNMNDYFWDKEVQFEYYDFWYRADSCMQSLMQSQNCKTDIPVNQIDTNCVYCTTTSWVLLGLALTGTLDVIAWSFFTYKRTVSGFSIMRKTKLNPLLLYIDKMNPQICFIHIVFNSMLMSRHSCL